MGFVPLIRGPSFPGVFHIPSGTYTLPSPSSGGSLSSEARGLMETSHLEQYVLRSLSLSAKYLTWVTVFLPSAQEAASLKMAE